MRRASAGVVVLGLALAAPAVCGLAPGVGAAAGNTGAAAGSAVAAPEAVSVRVGRVSGVRAGVHVSFRAGGQLRPGGYYYAVIVLRPYKHHTRTSPPTCATSSDMQRADYGYPRADGTVRLTLTPARSRARSWCHGGSYAGAVYAVPHPPPCEGRYPCSSEPYEPPSPCWKAGEHRVVCGVVIRRTSWAYPDGVPAPLAPGTRIVGRFNVSFR